MNDVISLTRGWRIEETLIGTSEQLGHIVSRPCDRRQWPIYDAGKSVEPETKLEIAQDTETPGCLRRETRDIMHTRCDNRMALSRDTVDR